MQLIEVKNTSSHINFLNVPKKLYKNDKNWICPLDSDITNVFTKGKNTFIEHGEAKRWVLISKKKLIGRIAAFYDKRKAGTFKQPTGGCGFFECINNQEAANILFDAAKNWLKSKNLEAMDGPINFGRNKKFWGLLIEGFMPQAYGMNYNPPYYKKLFENYGFKIFFKQYSYHLDITNRFPERYWRIADWIIRKDEYTFRRFNFNERSQFIPDLVKIYNEAWGAYKKDLTPMRPVDFEKILQEIKPILQEEFIWIAYHRKKPIAFLLMYPDYNQILKHFSGKVYWWEVPYYLWLKISKQINRTRVPILGLLPKYEKLGIEATLFRYIKQTMKKYPQYKEIELSWIGDFEPHIQKMYAFFGAKICKQHATFRYLFNRNIEFERYPIPQPIKNPV